MPEAEVVPVTVPKIEFTNKDEIEAQKDDVFEIENIESGSEEDQTDKGDTPIGKSINS